MSGTQDVDGGRPHQTALSFAKGSDTSEATAKSLATHAGVIRERVFAFILGTTAAGGTTCDNIEAWLRLRHQTCSARVRELFQAGRIVDSGRRGRTRSGRRARLYVARPQHSEVCMTTRLLSGDPECPACGEKKGRR